MWNGTDVLEFGAVSPAYADLSAGYAYALVLRNTTASDITSGTILFECAQSSPENFCVPGPWGPLPAVALCPDGFGSDPGQARIELSAAKPIPANSQCSMAAPCPCHFLRVSGVPAGLNASIVVSRLKRTGGPLIPAEAQHP
jgi:hypothetical protein